MKVSNQAVESIAPALSDASVVSTSRKFRAINNVSIK